MRLTLSFVLVLILAAVPAPAALAAPAPAEAPAPRVIVNGFDLGAVGAQPRLVDGRLYAPAAALAQAMAVEWEYAEESGVLRVAGREVSWLWQPGPFRAGDDLFVAVRPWAMALGAGVDWDARTLTAAVQGPVKVRLGDQTITYSYARAPHLHGGRAYMSLQALAEPLGLSWGYDAGTGQAWLGEGPGWTIQEAPHVEDGHPFVAVRPAAAQIGAKVLWDARTLTVTLIP